MSSIKVVLRKNKKRKDGTIPLAIRITKNRKTSYLFLKQYIKEKDWDERNRKVKTSHPNSARLNNHILKKLSEANDLLIEKETTSQFASSKQIKEQIKSGGKQADFFHFATSCIEEKKKLGKHGQYKTDIGRIKQFKTFVNDRNISFSEVTVALLNQYQVHLKVKYDLSKRTIVNHMILIRSIYNRAIKEGVAKREQYPFGKNGIKVVIPKSIKIGLNAEEIERIEKLELTVGTEIWHSRNAFLFSFYFAGMRISDVLNIRWSDVIDGRLLYQMNKNDKSGGVKISQKAQTILSRCELEKENNNDFIFPALKKANLSSSEDVYRKINSATKKINEYLKDIAELAEIEKNVSCHIARHSFGNIAGDRIPIQMLQKLYRHSDIQTTIGYQSNFMFKDTDEALEAVIGV